MELVLFIGLQGAGKSTFFARRFADTHVRINLDMLKTRRREWILFEACLSARLPTVVDNTNPAPADRARYIPAARERGYSVVGYYFQSKVEDCYRRNAQRPGRRAVPLMAVLGTAGRLVRPARAEGFDRIYYVRIDDAGQFVVEEWREEPGPAPPEELTGQPPEEPSHEV